MDRALSGCLPPDVRARPSPVRGRSGGPATRSSVGAGSCRARPRVLPGQRGPFDEDIDPYGQSRGRGDQAGTAEPAPT